MQEEASLEIGWILNWGRHGGAVVIAVPPTGQKHPCEANWQLEIVRVCLSVNGRMCLSFYMALAGDILFIVQK